MRFEYWYDDKLWRKCRVKNGHTSCTRRVNDTITVLNIYVTLPQSAYERYRQQSHTNDRMQLDTALRDKFANTRTPRKHTQRRAYAEIRVSTHAPRFMRNYSPNHKFNKALSWANTGATRIMHYSPLLRDKCFRRHGFFGLGVPTPFDGVVCFSCEKFLWWLSYFSD